MFINPLRSLVQIGNACWELFCLEYCVQPMVKQAGMDGGDADYLTMTPMVLSQ